MPILNSPFASATDVASPGRGEVLLTVLPPKVPSFATLSYQYPLKLLSRIPVSTLDSKYPASATPPVHLYLLTYGGGLLPGDYICVSIRLQPRIRLVLTTPQGTTKIFKTEFNGGRRSQHHGDVPPDMSKQTLNVQLESETGLCYLPDPSVPFENSRYEQFQRFTIIREKDSGDTETSAPKFGASLCVLDWVTEGRSARGEIWSFDMWKGRNEVWLQDGQTGTKRLLLRDSVILENDNKDGDAGSKEGLPPSKSRPSLSESFASSNSIAARADPHGIFGTLIIYGPLFDSLASFFMEQFSSQPRIGGKNWSTAPSAVYYLNTQSDGIDINDSDRKTNTKPIERDWSNVTWTAARIRNGFVLIKFGAKDFQTAADWLGYMLRTEGSIEREFGDEAFGNL